MAEGPTREDTEKRLEAIFSSALEGEELEKMIDSIPKRIEKFEGKWGGLIGWADNKYGVPDDSEGEPEAEVEEPEAEAEEPVAAEPPAPAAAANDGGGVDGKLVVQGAAVAAMGAALYFLNTLPGPTSGWAAK